jgi:hypothetical protein
MEVMKSYIKDPENKNIVFDTYLYLEEHNQERNPNGKEISDILACIQDVYPCKLI